MKVLDLRCSSDHRFEGWFASEDDFQSQSARGLVTCPVCGDPAIVRLPSAPRLNVSGAREPREVARARGDRGAPDERSRDAAIARAPAATPPAGGAGVPVPVAMQALWLQAVQHVLAHTDDVGDRFAEEARRIHYGEADERAIRGRASPEETQALLDEGIEVMPLPLPEALKGPVQ
ncbi:DUF1178 family protein [Piscinibacter sakaiensis]|uniref:DUF1178 family protein n=1 Tax=Piscinibacter sakaiensis TaxID=1547922 RepID=A0A0K8NZ46_PISS1|nr:DUF1178 family protein [Piscinibacter sakaiensis]GAP35589.1 hypothetical protein ISF6_1362 [Piscinibacter sakaiensis]